MHERALMDDLMRAIDRVVRAEGAQRATRVVVWLGPLSHMTPGHFRAHFEESSRGTPAEGAAVETEEGEDITAPDAQGVRLVSIDVE